MMKKAIWKTVMISCACLALLAALYLGLSVYYAEGFSYGTWVNGIYCTGKTVASINDELTSQETYEKITLILPDGRSEELSMQDVGYRISFVPPLEKLQEEQNSFLWPVNLGKEGKRKKLQPVGSLDEKLYSQAFEELDFVKERREKTEYQVYIRKTPEGYQLVNERTIVLVPDVCKEKVREAILKRLDCVDLREMGCYEDLPLDRSMQDTCALWEKINKFQDCGIVYCFGEEKEAVDASVVCEWITLDENGSFVLDENGDLVLDRGKIKEYVRFLSEKYDTYNAVRQFQATRGDIVSIDGGTYGNKIDQKAETDYLEQAFLAGTDELHEPAYERRALSQGKNDIGDTYIEVDMGEQMMYYYADGKQIIKTPIVTGNMIRKRDTPAMVCFVYGKQKNRILRGPGYASHVNFWMPVKGGIGIHDAKWRNEFGGDIYKTNGSHGCINTPYEAMETLYDMAPVGTPVVMFY